MTILRFIAVLCALAPAVSAADRDGWRATGAVDVGFDSFEERYSIVDEDTLDSITEFRSRLSLGAARGRRFRDYFHVEARALVGNESAEYAGRVSLYETASSGALRFGLNGDITRRAFRENSTYEFANDHTRTYLRSHVRWRFSPRSALRLTDRLERVDYEDRTEFDYDYTRNAVSLAYELDAGTTHFVSVGARFTKMSIPDSTGIQYEAWAPLLELRSYAAPARRLLLMGAVERRNYAHEPVRSSYWAVTANAEAEWPIRGLVSVLAENDLEHYDYDATSGAYFGYTENRGAVVVNVRPTWNLSVGAGPTFGLYRSAESPEDEYEEVGASLRVDYMRGARLWISAAYEPGRRDYDRFTGAESSIDDLIVFSDYTYHRISAFANVRLWDGVSASALLDYQPEDHEREGDDSTATLFSASISYAF